MLTRQAAVSLKGGSRPEKNRLHEKFSALDRIAATDAGVIGPSAKARAKFEATGDLGA